MEQHTCVTGSERQSRLSSRGSARKARVGEATFGLQAWKKQTVRCQSTRIIGTCWEDSSGQGEKFSCTPWAHSVCHLPPTAGAGSQQRLADLLHTSSPVAPARGSCFLPLEAGGTNFRPALLVCIHLREVVSCPLSWSKTSGSTTTRWVGFELLLREHAVGLSETTRWVGFEPLLREHAVGLTERRATWVVKWAREATPAGVVHMRAFEVALGRVVCATSALELLRLFFSPLCALRWAQR